MTLSRRGFLGGLGAAAILSRVRFAVAASPDPSPVLWVHLQASGGWDQALFCDPKASVRSALGEADRDVRMAGSIPYLAFADFGAPEGQGFFGRHHSRLLVFNGVDTGTNNHSVGEAYSAAGSTVPDYPCWAAQVAAVFGGGQPMPFISYGGYDRTGGLVAPARIPEGSERYLTALGTPTKDGNGQPFIDSAAEALVRAAHRERLLRQHAAARLPDQRRALEALLDARDAEGKLAGITIPAYDPTATSSIQRFKLALSAYQAGLTASVGVTSGGFDTHESNEINQRTALSTCLDTLSRIVDVTEAAGVPTVILATSDFGRTPHYTGTGTDHHPISSMLLLVNEPAQALDLGIPTGRVIGGTTDGDATTALQARRVDPKTLALSDQGIVLTPGHVLRALRRVAGLDGAPELATFPLSVEQDLAIG